MTSKGLILITRPKEQAKILSKQLESEGYQTLIVPLFKIVANNQLNSSLISGKVLQAVLITSGNAIPSLSKLSLPKKILILAVGKTTGKALRKSGYNNVICANNSAVNLQEFALQLLNPKKGLIIYLSGEKFTLDLALALSHNGYEAIRITAYYTKEKQSLPKNIIDKICDNSIDQIWIYSYNTALIFNRLILKHNLLEYRNHIKLLCLSEKIADYFIREGFKNVSIKNNDQ